MSKAVAGKVWALPLRSDGQRYSKAPITAPTAIARTVDSATQITLQASGSASGLGTISGYKYFRDGAPINQSSTASPLVDSGRTAATLYTYTAVAVDSAGNQSESSAAFTATTSATSDTVPPTVAVISAQVLSANSIRVSLVTQSTDASSGLRDYTLQWSISASGPWNDLQVAVQGAIFPYTHAGLTASTQRFYRLRAFDNVGNVSTSAVVNATTLADAGGGTVVDVTNWSTLQAAVAAAVAAGGNRTMRMASGVYTQTDALYVDAPNIKLISASGNRNDVTLRGDAMTGSAAVPFNVRVAAPGFEAEAITFGGYCRFSSIQIVGESNAINGRLKNCAVRDSFEHLVKGTTGAVTGAASWVFEGNLFEYSAGIAPAQYTGGIDMHRAANCTIRLNTFRGIASPVTSAAQGAVNLWNGSVGNVTERNTVIDCDRGICDGLLGPGLATNDGNIIRNNFIYHSNNAHPFADVQLAQENATNAQIHHNTVFAAHSFPWAAEHRYTTSGSLWRNNLLNKAIQARDGSAASVDSSNKTNAQASWFVNLVAGDLHLSSSIAGIVDAGVVLAGVTDDFDGTARPQGSGYDIGADEYVIAGSPLTLPLYDTSKITYLRKILVPNGGSPLNGGAGYQYPMRPAGIAFNPAGAGGAGSIFMSGGPETQPEVISEFTIPLTNNTRATVLQAFQLTAAGKQGQIKAGQLGLGQACTGLMIYNNRLIESWISIYDTDSQPTAYMARSSLTLAGGTCTNPQRVGTLTNQRFMSGLGCVLPANWQAVFGGYQAVGGGAGAASISGNYSCGPAMVLFNPDNLTGSGVVPGVELSYYQLGDMDAGFGPFSAMWTNNSHHRGTIFLPESRTVICFGKHGDSIYDNTLGGNTSKVQVRTRMWLYDAVDLKRVFDGQLTPRAVRPYATFDLSAGPSNGVPQMDEVRSCAWDATGRKLYVMAGHEDGSFPAIFVFSIPV